MLSKPSLHLLTAFVDGELNERQRKALMRLLNRSSEARTVLKQLQVNAHRLKKLPKHKIGPSLVDEILLEIAKQRTQPKPKRITKATAKSACMTMPKA